MPPKGPMKQAPMKAVIKSTPKKSGEKAIKPKATAKGKAKNSRTSTGSAVGAAMKQVSKNSKASVGTPMKVSRASGAGTNAKNSRASVGSAAGAKRGSKVETRGSKAGEKRGPYMKAMKAEPKEKGRGRGRPKGKAAPKIKMETDEALPMKAERRGRPMKAIVEADPSSEDNNEMNQRSSVVLPDGPPANGFQQMPSRASIVETWPKPPNTPMTEWNDAMLSDAYLYFIKSGDSTKENECKKEIGSRQASFIQSELTVVVCDVTNFGSTGFQAQVLKKVKKSLKVRHMVLMDNGYGPNSDKRTLSWNFKDFSTHVSKFMPLLETLYVGAFPVANFEVTGLQNLMSLHLCGTEFDNKMFQLFTLPMLERLTIDYCCPDPAGLAKSCFNCPTLRVFSTYKYIDEDGNGLMPTLYLPKCEHFTMMRSDCLYVVTAYLPRVEAINIGFNYDLEVFELLPMGHDRHKRWNLGLGKPQSKFTLFHSNTHNLDETSWSTFRSRLNNVVCSNDPNDLPMSPRG